MSDSMRIAAVLPCGTEVMSFTEEIGDALDYLRAVLAILDRDGGYRTAPDLETLRAARQFAAVK